MEGHDQLPAGTIWKQPRMLLCSWCTYFSRPRYRQLEEGDVERPSTGFISQEFASQVKPLNYIAWPMIVVAVSQFLLRLSPMFVLGHLGELPLSSASMATTFCNVTGFSVIVRFLPCFGAAELHVMYFLRIILVLFTNCLSNLKISMLPETSTLTVSLMQICNGLEACFGSFKGSFLECLPSFLLVLVGMASALETLCGQAYGAEQYQQVGNFTHAATLCLLLACLPISILWVFTDKLFIFIGQDPLISTEAGKYAIWLVPSLFAFAILQTLTLYLQIQKLMLPILLSSVASLLTNILLCWGSVFKLKLGSAGAALSIGISYWFNVALLLLYVKYSSACDKTHASFSKEVFSYVGKFFQYAVPSAMMVCLEWWCFELVILLSGILPNPQIEVNVLSISMTITALHFTIPNSFGAAASTRISNELGAGNPHAAQLAVYTAVILTVTEVLCAAAAIFFCRHVLGYAFIEEKEMVVYIEEMAPLLCFSIILDGVQAVLSGVARGGGWQQMAAYVNLGAYYAVGIPVALIMGFSYELRGEGLWMGLVAGAAVQCFFFSLVTCLTDWDKKATEARERIFGGGIPAQIQLT